MNGKLRRNIIGLTLGAVVMAGAMSPFVAQAAEQCDFNGPQMGHHRMNPAKMAENIADTFGVSKDSVLSYEKQGVHFRDLYKAAFLAKAGDKSLKEVMETKTLDNTWKDVVKALGITKGQIRAAHQDIEATKLEDKLHIAKQTSLDLMQEGYRGRDIAIANELSPNTGKTVKEILAMKQINNSWEDVAQLLGISDENFKKDMNNIKAAFPHHRGFQAAGF
jgi:hypothetical protein